MFAWRGEDELGTMTKPCPENSLCERSSISTNETWVGGRKDVPRPRPAGGSARGQPVSLPVV